MLKSFVVIFWLRVSGWLWLFGSMGGLLWWVCNVEVECWLLLWLSVFIEEILVKFFMWECGIIIVGVWLELVLKERYWFGLIIYFGKGFVWSVFIRIILCIIIGIGNGIGVMVSWVIMVFMFWIWCVGDWRLIILLKLF